MSKIMKAKIYLEDEDNDTDLITELYFNEEMLSSWYLNLDGEINATIDGIMFTFPYDEKLYNYLISKIE
jgi:hypothetical protein